jgi:hypothetical protein
MSSSSVENDSGEEEKNNGDAPVQEEHPAEHEGGQNGSHPAEEHMVELLQEERASPPTPEQIGNRINRYKAIQQLDNRSEDGSVEALPPRPGSPPESVLSNPDDTPSVQVIKSPSYIGPFSLTYRALSCLLSAEVVYYRLLHQDQVSKAQPPPSDHSTDVSNHASRALHIPCLAPPPPSSESLHDKPLSAAK